MPPSPALADTLRRSELGQTALDGLQTSFYKTELELGRCLQERLRTEEQLVADAAECGWAREAERHMCVVDRIRVLPEEPGAVGCSGGSCEREAIVAPTPKATTALSKPRD